MSAVINSAIPAHIAERAHDGGGCADEAHEEKLRERALEELVDTVMDGNEFPRRATRQQINLLDILNDCDQSLLASSVTKQLCSDRVFIADLQTDVKKIVSDWLLDTEWHELMIEKLREQDGE
jgi:hypothetical protein